MKIVVGVSTTEALQTVGGVLESLKFEKAQFDAAYVVERLGHAGTSPKGSKQDLISRYLKLQEEEGQKTLQEVKEKFQAHGLETKTSLLTGFAANALMEHAEKTGADLIAIGSSGKGPLEGILVGSTVRKTVIHSSTSVLIAKQPVTHKNKLKIVLATDLSDYAGRSLEAFVGFGMKGIADIVLTTVVPRPFRLASDDSAVEMASAIKEEVTSGLKAVATKLAPTHATIRTRIEMGPVGDTLERVMKEEKADLLVLGAQGHGFLHRMSIGSVSLEQAVNKPYSVMVIRVK